MTSTRNLDPYSKREEQKRLGALDLPNRQADLIFGAAIGLATIITIWVRWSGLSSQSLWADEGYTAWISQFSPTEIWRILRSDSSPPLYYVVLHYWSAVFGDSETSLRALSAFFGTVSLPLIYLIARKILPGRMSVALAMLLCSVSFFQVWYAKEARCYALLVFLSLGSVYCALLCLEKTSTLRLLGLVLSISASLYTHNIAWFYLPGLAVIWWIYPTERTIGARIQDASIIALIALLLYIPWVPSLRAQVRVIHGSFWAPQPKPRDLLETLSVFNGFDTRTFQDIFRSHFHSTPLFGFWTWAPAFLAVFVFCVIGAFYAVRSADRRRIAALLAYSLLPILLVFLDSRFSTPIYVNRVFAGPCVLLPVVLCAPIAFQMGNRKRLFQFIGFVALLGAATSTFGYLRRERREDWRGATEYLLTLRARPRLVVVASDYCQMVVSYYSTHFFKGDSSIEIDGPTTKFEPHNPDFEASLLTNEMTVDPLKKLALAMNSGKYREIDFALQPSAAQAKIIAPYLAARCGSVEVVEFHWLEVRRCFTPSNSEDAAQGPNLPAPTAETISHIQ